MLFFKCNISYNEIVAIQKNLPSDAYCISKNALNDYHYGVVAVSSFNSLLDVLSGETLAQMEYLDHDEFREAAVNPDDNEELDQHFFGNTDLIDPWG